MHDIAWLLGQYVIDFEKFGRSDLPAHEYGFSVTYRGNKLLEKLNGPLYGLNEYCKKG